MFSFGKPKCPIDEETRIWIDERMEWLVDQFGREQLRKTTVIEPTLDYFPEPYEATEECIDALFVLMCQYMQVDPQRVTLQFYDDYSPVMDQSDGINDFQNRSAGLYNEADGTMNVWLNVRILEDPPAVAATMAHELGHVHLLGDRRISQEEEDHEAVTDLLTVFFGLGVLSANAALRDSNTHYGNWESWSVARQGYLTMDAFGYALAWFARERFETAPDWARHLRLDVHSAFKAATKYLAKQE